MHACCVSHGSVCLFMRLSWENFRMLVQQQRRNMITRCINIAETNRSIWVILVTSLAFQVSGALEIDLILSTRFQEFVESLLLMIFCKRIPVTAELQRNTIQYYWVSFNAASLNLSVSMKKGLVASDHDACGICILMIFLMSGTDTKPGSGLLRPLWSTWSLLTVSVAAASDLVLPIAIYVQKRCPTQGEWQVRTEPSQAGAPLQLGAAETCVSASSAAVTERMRFHVRSIVVWVVIRCPAHILLFITSLLREVAVGKLTATSVFCCTSTAEIFQGAQDRYFHLMAMSNGPEMGNRLGRVVKFTETPLSADRDLPVAERENYKRATVWACIHICIYIICTCSIKFLHDKHLYLWSIHLKVWSRLGWHCSQEKERRCKRRACRCLEFQLWSQIWQRTARVLAYYATRASSSSRCVGVWIYV